MKLIGLDVGTKRIGVAKADTSVRIAVPDGFVAVNGQEFSEIARIARLYDSNVFVVGLPRNNQGEETAQSAYVRKFANVLAQTIPGSRIYFQDESLTSVEAEKRLKARKRNYSRGDIDAEAAAIILQDCIEHFTNRSTQSSTKKSDIGEIWAGIDNDSTQSDSPSQRKRSTARKMLPLLIGLIVLIGGGLIGGNLWYQSQLQSIATDSNCQNSSTEAETCQCQPISFTVESQSVAELADELAAKELIRNPLAFRLYAKFSGRDNELKMGQYLFCQSMSTPEIFDKIVTGDSVANVFNFTIIPGDTLAKIKQRLLAQGYSAEQIDTAFNKDYSEVNDRLKTLLASKPAEVSLEGYLLPETYQFYNDETVENIIIRALEQLYETSVSNDLFNAYVNQGLNFHEGLTLASIVQKEANADDQPGVARVFLNRLRQGIMLGSDVTASYAADLVDPNRETYTDNAAVLEIESPYNTRKTAGLPPSPIASPSVSALVAVARPTDSDYLYFLTGDDGVVYYSYTEDEHNQNATDHCQKLCNVQL